MLGNFQELDAIQDIESSITFGWIIHVRVLVVQTLEEVVVVPVVLRFLS
jgi:hypothetical protein